MRTLFAIALAIAAVCVTAAWAGWNDAFQVTDNELVNSIGPSNARKVVIGTVGSVDNVVHAVWHAGEDVYYKRYFPGSGWSEELKIGDSEGGGDPCPAIALDANGKDIHVVWESKRTSGKGKNQVSDRTIYYRKCVVTGAGNGGWGNTADLCVIAEENWGRMMPCIACGASGQVVVAWSDNHNGSHWVTFREYVSGAWQDEDTIADPSDTLHYRPSIAADGSGDVCVTYTLYHLPLEYGPWRILVTRRLDGDWTDPEGITPADDDFRHSVIEVNPVSGHPHLLCWGYRVGGVSDDKLFHTYRTDDGWEDLEVILERGWFPQMFFTADGVAHVVCWFKDPDLGTEAIMYASCPYEGGTWTEPEELAADHEDVYDVRFPQIAGSADGTLFAMWQGTSTRVDTIITKKKVEIIEVTEQQIWGTYYTPEGGGEQARSVASSQLGVELVPNPARTGRVAVRYSLPRAGQMTVSLVDISGRVVQTQEVAAHGLRGSVSVDVSGLTAGVYVARVVAGDLDVSQPLVIAR